jgi:hypothetical protein
MRRLIVVAAAGLIAVGIAVWLNAASRSTTEPSVSRAALSPSISISRATTKAPAISVPEIHNQAHMKKLPVTDFEDQSLVFTHPGSVPPVW